jgi:hypothetical protein
MRYEESSPQMKVANVEMSRLGFTIVAATSSCSGSSAPAIPSPLSRSFLPSQERSSHLETAGPSLPTQLVHIVTPYDDHHIVYID